MEDYYEFEEEEFTTQFNGSTLMRILAQTRPHLRYVIGFLFFIIAVAIIDSTTTYLSKQIIDVGIIPGDRDALVRIMSQYVGLFILQAFGVFGFIYSAAMLGAWVEYDLRKRMFNKLQELSFSYFDQTPVGWIMSRVTSDSQRIAELVSWGLLDTVWGITRIITAFIFMMLINVR
jgi:ATP-binding cassette subfamily B protein